MSKDKIDEKLLARLLKAEPCDVDCLVEIITDFGRGRIILDLDVKEKLVYSKRKGTADRYDEDTLVLIIKELQGFAGNSPVNTFRKLFNQSFVSYDEIVDDVYTKLNGLSERDTVEKEKQIALAIFGDKWEALTSLEKYEKSTRNNVVSGGFDIEKAFKNHNLSGYMKRNYGLLAGALSLPLAGVVSTYTVLSEAYRITIPFVAQMGCIALKEVF